ncbi:hypothetical protein WJX72_006587 [[Myrmecia] bisecta]|uniref:ABM domain-containing protein n=1 Tax=[Myrmecia] bisecta TaxID=41462 RepID=A0AAW1PK88_9CHLO
MVQQGRLLQVLTVIGAFTIGLLIGSSWTAKRRYGADKPVKQAFALFVSVTFQSVEDRDKFISFVKPLAKHVAEHEPDTLAYEFGMADNNPLEIHIFERYKSRSPAYEHTHRSSEPFKRFQAAVKESGMVLKKTGQSFIEADIGYM